MQTSPAFAVREKPYIRKDVLFVATNLREGACVGAAVHAIITLRQMICCRNRIFLKKLGESYMFKDLFDERNTRWLKFYKVITITTFFIIALLGLIAGIDDVTGFIYLFDVDILGGDGFLDFMAWVIIGELTAFCYLVVNMLAIQYFQNVQAIRKSLEK